MNGVVVVSAFMLLLLVGGVWVAVALGSAGFFGLYSTLGFERALNILGIVAWQMNTSFVLIAFPLFLFMGEVLYQAGIMKRIYNATNVVVRFLPGGLLQTNIASCTVFAACSGSSLVAASTIGSVGYPQIVPKGYDRRLALGSIAAGGTLGILIPPSIIFIIYGNLAEVSIGRLFIAGIVPGLILASLYTLYIAVLSLARPEVAPREEKVGFKEVLRALASLWQVALLVVVVIGGIYGGIASPTEVAALGAAMALVFAAIGRTLTFAVLHEATRNTVRQTTMILFIIFTAKLIAMTLLYHQVPDLLAEWTEEVGATPIAAVMAVCLIYLVLGIFFDGLSMMVITVPFVVPIMEVLGVDLVWLGVLVVLMIEIGLLTPPMGLNLYVLQAATGETIKDIAIGAIPFIILQLVTVALVMTVPDLALYLPSKMF